MTLQIRKADYSNFEDAQLLVGLLDQYARDPYGGGQGLSNYTKTNLARRLRELPNAMTLIAFKDKTAVGISNCFVVFSTFKCKPVLNIHDFAVIPSARQTGVGLVLLEAIEQLAREQGCCKITLEVLDGNAPAKSLYQKFGFEGYELNPQHGAALFWEKPL